MNKSPFFPSQIEMFNTYHEVLDTSQREHTCKLVRLFTEKSHKLERFDVSIDVVILNIIVFIKRNMIKKYANSLNYI